MEVQITHITFCILSISIVIYILLRLTTGTCNNSWFKFHNWVYKYNSNIKASNNYLGKGFNVYYRNITRTCSKCNKIEDVK